MDREHDARRCFGFGQRLRKTSAKSGLRARVSPPTGLRDPAALSTAGGLSGAAGTSSTAPQCGVRSADGQLAGSGGGPGSRACASVTASTGNRAPTASRSGAIGPTGAPGRGRPGPPESLLCLDPGLLGLEGSLGMGHRPVGATACAHCRLGKRPLGTERLRLDLDRRRLALDQRSFGKSGQPSRSDVTMVAVGL
jgi:hypothetical protein